MALMQKICRWKRVAWELRILESLDEELEENYIVTTMHRSVSGVTRSDMAEAPYRVQMPLNLVVAKSILVTDTFQPCQS